MRSWILSSVNSSKRASSCRRDGRHKDENLPPSGKPRWGYWVKWWGGMIDRDVGGVVNNVSSVFLPAICAFSAFRAGTCDDDFPLFHFPIHDDGGQFAGACFGVGRSHSCR